MLHCRNTGNASAPYSYEVAKVFVRGDDGETRFQLRIEVVEDRLIGYIVAIMEQNDLTEWDPHTGLQIPRELVGVVMPSDEPREKVQARIDRLAADIQSQSITGMHWMDKGYGVQGPTLQVVEASIADISERNGRRRGTIIDVEGRVLPDQRRLS